MKGTIHSRHKAAKGMRLKLVILGLVLIGQVEANIMLALSPSHTGNYWWNRNQWSGGSTESDGFSYGATDTGLINTQRLYYYYGGADRYFQAADIYFQVPLSSLSGLSVQSVSFNFYVETLNTSAETFLKHLDTQATAPTGDAAQELAGDTNVFSSTGMTTGWNQIDVTDSILSDLVNGYDYAVFSIPRFAQAYEENRLLSIYGASAADVDGASVKPYLEAVVPEPSSYAIILGCFALTILFWRRR